MISPTENRNEPQKQCVVCTKGEDEKIVDINAKYMQTTVGYVLPHALINIMKNKIKGVTKYWLCNVYIYIMKRLFSVTFDSLNLSAISEYKFWVILAI